MAQGIEIQPTHLKPDFADWLMNSAERTNSAGNQSFKRVSITTGARLHFGFFSVNQPQERQFGGVGVMIDSPGVSLTAAPSSHRDIAARLGDVKLADAGRVLSSAKRFRLAADDCLITPINFQLHTAIPAHRGLGSGTQLGLAVGRAMSILSGDPNASVVQLARRVGRGNRSAIGIHGFEHGGLIVDGGSQEPDEIGELTSRHAFPEAWRFVLVFPRARAGLSGSQEHTAFAELPPMPTATTARLKMLTSDVIQPGVAQQDFHAVAKGLREFGYINGEYFSPIQGGVFTNPEMADLAEWLRARGNEGVGQSSWGPALWTLCDSQPNAEGLIDELQSTKWGECEFTIAKPMNHGALIQTES